MRIRETGAPAAQADGTPIWYAEPRDQVAKLSHATEADVVERRIETGRKALTGATEMVDARAPSYFRTYEQVRDAMFALQEKYPDLVEVVDIGDSSEKVRGLADRDMWRIRITNKKNNDTTPKPKALWIAGMHAREIGNPELALRWVETLLEAYATDPEARALLDTRVLDLVPIANPDGHAKVEAAYEGARGGNKMQRKNTSPPDGTDLNRNGSFMWGGPGASRNPRSETYRGPSAASEPEVQAIEAQVRSDDYNIVIDWHSHSELVLYPWGHTREKAPDHEGLKAVAERFASFNGYSPIQGVDLYPTSGTTEGVPYGELGIPAFTVETGRSFHQSDREWERVRQENWPVMTYSLKIADDPYERAKAPMVARVKVNPDTGKLTAEAATTVSSATLRGFRPRSTMAAAEYVLDPTTPPGQGIPLKAADGALDETHEALFADVSSLLAEPAPADGRLVYVRAQDSDGNWGPLTAQWLAAPQTKAAEADQAA